MGIYLNPGSKGFEMAVNSQIYIDKTGMIRHLNSLINTEQRYVCVSRPRRFGKTMAAKMLCAYYSKGTEGYRLFEKSVLASSNPEKDQEAAWDVNLGRFNVIRLVMTDFFKTSRDVGASLDILEKRVIKDIKKQYPEIRLLDDTDLMQAMSDVYDEYGHSFIVIIDEWDSVFRVQKEDTEGQVRYLNFLRDLLKDKDYIALAYMTGILPIKKYGQHSALNMFSEYAMTHQKQLASYTGFTEREVKELCQAYNMSYDEISDWYDGYLVSEDIPIDKRDSYRRKEYTDQAFSIYNPLSVVEAMLSGEIRNYWNRTETYEALADYIRMDFDGMKSEVALMMDGGRVKVDISKYQNDMTTFYNKDDVLTLLVHLGYLSYDAETGEAFIPNREILDEFRISTDTEDWNPVFKALRESDELLKAPFSLTEK